MENAEGNLASESLVTPKLFEDKGVIVKHVLPRNMLLWLRLPCRVKFGQKLTTNEALEVV